MRMVTPSRFGAPRRTAIPRTSYLRAQRDLRAAPVATWVNTRVQDGASLLPHRSFGPTAEPPGARAVRGDPEHQTRGDRDEERPRDRAGRTRRAGLGSARRAWW